MARKAKAAELKVIAIQTKEYYEADPINLTTGRDPIPSFNVNRVPSLKSCSWTSTCPRDRFAV